MGKVDLGPYICEYVKPAMRGGELRGRMVDAVFGDLCLTCLFGRGPRLDLEVLHGLLITENTFFVFIQTMNLFGSTPDSMAWGYCKFNTFLLVSLFEYVKVCKKW